MDLLMGFAAAGRSEAIPCFDVELKCGAVLMESCSRTSSPR